MVVRARVPFDNLDQVGAFDVGQRVLLRPRQEMQGGIMGGFADTGLGLGAGTRTQDMSREAPRQARRLAAGGCQTPLSRTSRLPANVVGAARIANVRLPSPIAAFRAQGRLGQLSAINRHNQQLLDDLVGAQQN